MAVPKALLRRCSVDWHVWDAWADRSAKALLRGVHIFTLNLVRLSSALPLQGTERLGLTRVGRGLFDNGPPPHRPLKRNLDRERQAH